MFISVFSNVAVMLVYMALGFILCKSGKGVAAHAKTMSGLLIYILGPTLIVNSFIQLEYDRNTVQRLALFFVTTLIIQLLFFAILYLILRKKYTNPAYRIFTVGAVLGNVGFLGLPLITGIFPEEPIVACYSAIYVVSMNLLVFTVGAFLITNDKKFVSFKNTILNPSTIALIISLFIFFLKIDFPVVVDNTVLTLSRMVTPFCMIILGMRLSAANLKDLFTRGFVYATCAMKLVVFPLFAYALVYFLPFDNVFKVSILILSGTPTGAIVQSMAELQECEQEFSANVVLLTTILSVITIPLLTLIVR